MPLNRARMPLRGTERGKVDRLAYYRSLYRKNFDAMDRLFLPILIQLRGEWETQDARPDEFQHRSNFGIELGVRVRACPQLVEKQREEKRLNKIIIGLIRKIDAQPHKDPTE